MPRTRSIAWSELKLGIVGIIALALLSLIVVAIGGQGGFPWQRYPLKARFNQVSGLKTGAVVRLNGKEVGKVTDIEFAGQQIEVTFELSKSVRNLVTTEATASLGSVSLLGEPIVDIKASNRGSALPDWAYVRVDQTSGFSDLTQSAAENLEQVGNLITDIRSGRGTIGKFFTDPSLYNEMRDLASSAGTVAKYLQQGKGTLGRLTQDPTAYNELKSALERLDAITEKVNTGEGPLGRLLNDKAMASSLAGTTSNMEQITGRLSRGEGTAGKLLTDQQLYTRFTGVATRLEQLVSGVEAGQGTAGSLLKDRQLYENMNQAASELRTLIAEIRKDPKKYLNVRVSIF
jgi:phospholipid/cholesterol/gamma-HCH transport system substrate-binding protein